MNIPKNPFFKLEDFKNVEMTIEGTNSTSQIKIPGSPKSIELIEVLDDGLRLLIPARCCAMGHTLALTIDAHTTAIEAKDLPNLKLSFTGVIEEIEDTGDDKQQVKMRFRQYSIDQWNKLLQYFSETQFTVNKLIKSSRK